MANSPHLGILNDGLGTRVVIVMRQLPKEPSNSLIIKVDNMIKNVDRDELLALVNDPNSLREKDLSQMLHRRGLLDHFHHSKYIEKVSIDKVLMTPGDGKRYPLREIIDSLNAKNGLPPTATERQLDDISEGNPNAAAKQEELLGTNERQQIANNLFTQWKFMFADAERKLNEALQIDSNLKVESDKIKKNSIYDASNDHLVEKPAKKTKSKKTDAA